MPYSFETIQKIKDMPQSIREYHLEDAEFLKWMAFFEELYKPTSTISSESTAPNASSTTALNASSTTSLVTTLRSEPFEEFWVKTISIVVGVILIILVVIVILICCLMQKKKNSLVVLSKAPKARSETWDTINGFEI